MSPHEAAFCAYLSMADADAELAFRLVFDRVPRKGELERLKEDRALREFVEELTERRSRLVSKRVTDRQGRLDRLNETWLALRAIVEARKAKFLALGNEATTGYMVQKKAGSEDFDLDTALLRELRDVEEQASREMGQWGSSNAALDRSAGRIVIVLPDNGRSRTKKPGVGGRAPAGPVDPAPQED